MMHGQQNKKGPVYKNTQESNFKDILRNDSKYTRF
jgi:hypothetical protein